MACQSLSPRLGYELEAAAAAALAFISADRRQRASEAERLRVWKRESRSLSRFASTWHNASGADSNTPSELDYKSSVFFNWWIATKKWVEKWFQLGLAGSPRPLLLINV